MKTLLKKAFATLMAITMILLVSAPALAENTSDELDATLELSNALNNIGLTMDFELLRNQNGRQSCSFNNIPHISKISEVDEILISSEEDVDVLLAIVQAVHDNQLYGLSMDSCIEIAIVEANLEDYLTLGLRNIFQEARENALYYLISNYTNDELYEMGLFDRFGIDFESRELVYTQEELMEIIFEQYNALQTSRANLPINPITLQSAIGRKSFALVPGDRIGYNVQHRTLAGTSSLQVGITNSNSNPNNSAFYRTHANNTITRTDTASFIVGSIGVTPTFFALRNTSTTTSTVVSGINYTVNW